MKTYLSYDTDVEQDMKIIEIPESVFECPKMNVGDLMSLCAKQLNGENILTPVKVTHVSIGIEWKESKMAKYSPKIKCAEQFLYVNPLVLEHNEEQVDNYNKKPFSKSRRA